ncbi:replication protein [Paenibacillus alkalitolerans]|uniref:replication protein n=1 Tax=Paenibacillus alkalitolerans TaxID=2799335 RepID=UPI0018F48A6F|nr:replication protein [Paenibacillus alkalitolerans]
MADVQPEHGFTKLADEILEAMARIKLSPTQYRVLFVVWRYTYGFNRKEHPLSLKFISEATGCDKRQLQREITKLEERKVITQKIKNGAYRIIQFNKNYDEWIFETIGETTIGEIDNGDSTNVGETVNASIGEIDNGTIGETDNQDIQKTTLKTKHIYTIFEFWNSKGIMKHRNLSDRMKSAINARLDDYSVEELQEAISNYHTILTSELYFWSYKWSLLDFMNDKNVVKFITENNPFETYRKQRRGNNAEYGRGTPGHQKPYSSESDPYAGNYEGTPSLLSL